MKTSVNMTIRRDCNEIIRKLAQVHAIMASEGVMNDEAFNLCCEILDFCKKNNMSIEDIKAMGTL